MTPPMGPLHEYLKRMGKIRSSGEASDETSYYPALEQVLNRVGGDLTPAVHCVLTPKNRGAGIPDGGLFVMRAGVEMHGDLMTSRAPERGVVEVKGLRADVADVAKTGQVRRYLDRYGQVLLSNYRQFLVLRQDVEGNPIAAEEFELAPTPDEFWTLASGPDPDVDIESRFVDFCRRALLADAPLSSPEDLAWFLAAYARTARKRMDGAASMHALDNLRDALQDALGLRFEGEEGEDFFRSTLVQTLFYGVFAAWVFWSQRQPDDSAQRFSWKVAQWTLNVPMVRVLFEQLALPSHLPAGLDEVLDWTEDVLARIDRKAFFARFHHDEAVQYFYEPFLEAYDPNLRKLLGVWYTPPEVVRYMVARVHQTLQRDLGITLGLADRDVHILDPCTGTGSFLVEALRTIARTLSAVHGDDLVADEVKAAALTRVHGFELLPAPFVVAHLQQGLLLDGLGAPLVPRSDERARVYLTNALTGWWEQAHPALPYAEFERERDAAEHVKRNEPILVVLGNPPYNGYAGVSGVDEGGLVDVYKAGLSQPPWVITKNKLDDLYIRFFRIAERRVAEQTGRGIVCFISNFGWLGDPSAVVMRKRMVEEFDRVYVDNLNGDSRETGKKTPDGTPDPSVFSTHLNPAGIQVGTAVATMVRTGRNDTVSSYLYRDFWGAEKRRDLVASLDASASPPAYQELKPSEANWFRLRRWNPRAGYDKWPSVTDIAATKPKLGLNENRGEALIDSSRPRLEARMRHFLDPGVPFSQLDRGLVGSLLQPWARYDAEVTRSKLLSDGYRHECVVRYQVKPFDVRWAYIDTRAKLWNEPRGDYVRSVEVGSEFLLVRRRAPRALDGAAALLSPHLVDQHLMHKDAYTVPLLLAADEEDSGSRLFSLDAAPPEAAPWRPNLSQRALDYLRQLGYTDVTTRRDTARLLWLHFLAVCYSPLYLEENGDAIRNDWPRVPLPETRGLLEHSAKLGSRVAALLGVDRSIQGVDTRAIRHLEHVGTFRRRDTKSMTDEHRLVTAGWGVRQTRVQNSGAVTQLVMPGDGWMEQRGRTHSELTSTPLHHLGLLGDAVVDIYLNESAWWTGVPQAAWDYKIGGFQVLRKWLSYREHDVLGRALTVQELRDFTRIAKRLTELVLLGDAMDSNYRAATGADGQAPLAGAHVF